MAMQNYDGLLRSDEDLAEAIRNGDQTEQAISILWGRYQPQLTGFLSAKLPPDWITDTAQDIWLAFYTYTRVSKKQKSVFNMLWHIARDKRTDAVRKLIKERSIE